MRRGIGVTATRAAALAATLLCGLAALAVPGASGAPAPAEGPSVSFHPPREAEPGARIAARGRVAGIEGRGTVQAQLLADDGWRTIARVGVGNGRFRLSLRLPGAGATATLRGAVLAGGRRVAVSDPTRVRLLAPSAGLPVAGPPAPSPLPAAAATSTPSPIAPIDLGPAPPPAEPEQPGEPEPPEGPEPPGEPSDLLYWGAWINPGTPVQPAPINPTAISQFEAIAGKPLSLLESYSAFFQCSGGSCSGEYAFPQQQLEAIRSYGAVPLFTWASESSSGEVSQPNFQLSDIAAGSYDTYIRQWATAAKAWGHPFFLRFDWEMNGNWFPWGQGVNGNQAGEYVAAWRHVHDIFGEVGATNASWVWCPFVAPRPTAGLYPGDQYVDWTCLDGYNRVTETVPWRSFKQVFAPAYKEITETIAPSKPMLIAEVASAEAGAPAGKSKAEWITQMFEALPSEFPAVRGLLWFDYEEGGKGWPLETSAAAEDAFATAIADPRYLGNDFAGLATSPIPPP